jgi:hypothetical protein
MLPERAVNLLALRQKIMYNSDKMLLKMTETSSLYTRTEPERREKAPSAPLDLSKMLREQIDIELEKGIGA